MRRFSCFSDGRNNNSSTVVNNNTNINGSGVSYVAYFWKCKSYLRSKKFVTRAVLISNINLMIQRHTYQASDEKGKKSWKIFFLKK